MSYKNLIAKLKTSKSGDKRNRTSLSLDTVNYDQLKAYLKSNNLTVSDFIDRVIAETLIEIEEARSGEI